jgi:hypothetical protein
MRYTSLGSQDALLVRCVSALLVARGGISVIVHKVIVHNVVEKQEMRFSHFINTFSSASCALRG